MTIGCGVFSLGITASIDISLFIAIYGKNPLVRFICGNLAFLWFIMTLLFASSLAMVITKAHWSYQSMNSLIATKKWCWNWNSRLFFYKIWRWKTFLSKMLILDKRVYWRFSSTNNWVLLSLHFPIWSIQFLSGIK